MRADTWQGRRDVQLVVEDLAFADYRITSYNVCYTKLLRIVDKLCESAQNPRAHRYSASKGIPGLRKALAGYYQRRFNVDLDVEREIVVTLGSKEGLSYNFV